MSTKYRFKIDPSGADLELEHSLIFPDSWTDKADSDKLIVGAGSVDSSDATRLICHSGPPTNTPVLTLTGASWSSGIGDTGAAKCDLCKGTPDDQTWTLTAKS